MEINEIKQKIHEKYPEEYTSEGSMLTLLEEIEDMQPEIRLALEKLLNNGEYSDIEVEGYNIRKLKEEHGYNEIAALLNLDWLKKEPDKAKESLERGYDELKL